jgi:hypothetical protein
MRSNLCFRRSGRGWARQLVIGRQRLTIIDFAEAVEGDDRRRHGLHITKRWPCAFKVVGPVAAKSPRRLAWKAIAFRLKKPVFVKWCVDLLNLSTAQALHRPTGPITHLEPALYAGCRHQPKLVWPSVAWRLYFIPSLQLLVGLRIAEEKFQHAASCWILKFQSLGRSELLIGQRKLL